MSASSQIPEFPFPIEFVRGGEVSAHLAALRQEYRGSGRVPVALGSRRDLAGLSAIMEDNFQKAKEALPIQESAEEWFEQHLANNRKAYPSLDGDEFDPVPITLLSTLQVGFTSKGTELPEIAIALIDAGESWGLPLALGYGSWDMRYGFWSFPNPQQHTLVAKYWFEKYGAEIAAILPDAIEFTVAHPPTDSLECQKLARQMYLYCPNVVEESNLPLVTLAKCVEGLRRWIFWWD